MADAPTGTVTFLFTDIEGSTRLGEDHPTDMQVVENLGYVEPNERTIGD